ncbi:hypothetical protein DSECCO2_213160 [anaerobic digester metagenome]
MSGSVVVLRVPYETTSFHDAITTLGKTFPVATRAARHELLDRVREWTGITVALDDAAYIPLKTDWIPLGQVPRRTADGAEILLAGRWPSEVQQAINAGKTVRIPGTPLEWFWGMMCDVETNHDGPPTDGGPEVESALAAGAAESAAESPAERQDAAPVAAPETGADLNESEQSEAPEVAPEPVERVVQPVAARHDETLGPDDPVSVPPVDAGERPGPETPPPVEGSEAESEGAGHAAGVPALEPVIPDEEIDAVEPWTPEGDGPDGFTRIVKALEHYGARFPPGFFDRPIKEVREGLKEAARGEKVREAYRRAQEGEARRQEEHKYDRFFTTTKNGVVILYYSEIGAYLREEFCALTFNKTLYIYNEETGLYVENAGQVESAIQEIAETVGFEGKITAVKREVMSYVKDHNVVEEYPFNRYPGIPAANGVIVADFEDGQFRLESYRPEMYFTYKIPAVYDPAASPDAIDAVLRQWVDPEDVPALYQIPAQAVLHQLGRKKPYKKCYLLHGDPDAGKTTYLELLFSTFGARNCSMVALQRIGNDRFYKGAIEGKVFNIYDDLADVPFYNTGELKALTGGFEHDIERKGKDSYHGRIFAVHIFTCNKPPHVDDRNKTDSAFWGRWEYLTFPNSFPKDPSWNDRMLTPENVSGFLNAVLKTALEIRERGALLVDSSAYEVRDRWSYNSDPIYRFKEENLEQNATGKIPKAELWSAFQKYANYEGIDAAKIPASLDAFAKRIFSYGFGATKATIDGKRVPVFTGYAWLPTSRYRPEGTTQAALGGGR